MSELTQQQRAELFDNYNRKVAELYAELKEAGAVAEEMPVGMVQFVPIENVQANDYNPNAVAAEEMRLLHTSIAEDGYTQPTVTIWDEELEKYVIVDGYHRYTTMRKYEDIRARTGGFLPVVVIDKPIEDRIASTVRHNRARGKHSVTGMGSLVFQMLQAGEGDAEICRKLGVDAEELARLKHVTGYSKLFKDMEYSKAVLARNQMTAKAEYKRAHPDEEVPQF